MINMLLLFLLVLPKAELIQWEPSTSAAEEAGAYNVYKAPLLDDGTCGAFVKLATTLGTAFVDTNLVAGSLSCYQVTFQETATGGESDPSDVYILDLHGPLAPVLTLTVQ